MHPNTKDLTGQRFGRLVVIKMGQQHITPAGRKELTWLCKCDCGGEKTVRARYLGHGTESCGCLATENGKRAGKLYNKIATEACRLAPGVAGRNLLLKSYKEGAAKRNLVFELSDKFFDTVTKQNCYYCDKPPSQMKRRKSRADDGPKWDEHSAYTYNGIDRVDNTKGYIESNCVACCKECNSKKKNVTMEIARKMVNFEGV